MESEALPLCLVRNRGRGGEGCSMWCNVDVAVSNGFSRVMGLRWSNQARSGDGAGERRFRGSLNEIQGERQRVRVKEARERLGLIAREEATYKGSADSR